MGMFLQQGMTNMAEKQKVLYFTEGATPTPEELDAFDQLVEENPGIDFQARNASVPQGEYDTLEEADFVTDGGDGSKIPPQFPEETYPRFVSAGGGNGGAAPAPTEMLLTSGTKFTAPAITGTYVDGYTPTIVDGAITELVAS